MLGAAARDGPLRSPRAAYALKTAGGLPLGVHAAIAWRDSWGARSREAALLKEPLHSTRGRARAGFARSPHRAAWGSTVVKAYILIQSEVGKATAVAELISEIPGVVQAEDVTGPYDVIVRAEADTVDDLGKLVVARIQQVEGITRTLTCPVVNL